MGTIGHQRQIYMFTIIHYYFCVLCINLCIITIYY